MTVEDYRENAQFNFEKSLNSPERAMGLGSLRLHTKAKLLGAKDTDSWYDWEDKVMPDLSELRNEMLNEALEERRKQLIKEKMELKELTLENTEVLVKFLIDHMNYSMKDIKSYDDLTNEEKKLITEQDFKTIFK